MDHKWAVIAARSGVKTGIVSAIVWALYDYASQQQERGDVSDFDVETYSVYSGFSEDEINSVISALNDKGVIENGQLTAWDKWQPQREDNSKERTREWRNRKRNDDVTDVTDVTHGDAMKRNVTHCDAPEKEKEEEKDKDKEGDKERVDAQSISPVQAMIEKVTGLMPLPGDVKVIDEIAEMNPTQEDIQAAYDWYVGQGKKFRYYSSIVGPIRTAQAKRIQDANGPPKSTKTERIQDNNQKLIQKAVERNRERENGNL